MSNLLWLLFQIQNLLWDAYPKLLALLGGWVLKKASGIINSVSVQLTQIHKKLYLTLTVIHIVLSIYIFFYDNNSFMIINSNYVIIIIPVRW